MRPTLRPSEVAPYRCGSLLGRASEPCPLKGPSVLAYVESGHVALPPRGSKRLGPHYSAGRLAEAQESWSTGGEARPRKTGVGGVKQRVDVGGRPTRFGHFEDSAVR